MHHPFIPPSPSAPSPPCRCVGGLLSLSEALHLALVRGLAMDSLPADSGGMLAVGGSAEALEPYVAASSGKVSFAAFNSAKSTVLSGEKAAIFNLHAECQAKGMRATLLAVGHGFHSADVEGALPALYHAAEAVIRDTSGASAPTARGLDSSAHGSVFGGLKSLPLVISTHTGRPLSERADVHAAHWVRHARDPVAFRDAVSLALSA
eukprot:3296294-Prymnesium_polylepis.1